MEYIYTLKTLLNKTKIKAYCIKLSSLCSRLLLLFWGIFGARTNNFP
nr:MAG TPA: hypothetical protein [Caudoviricetes sp.]